MEMKMQDSIERFLDSVRENEELSLKDAEICMELFADYLIYYSDLFQEEEQLDEVKLDEWEAALEGYVEKLFDGDMDGAPDLGGLPLSLLDAEYVRDFVGWYLLRDPSINSLLLEKFVQVVRQWLQLIQRERWLEPLSVVALLACLDEVAPEASRAAKAAHILLYFVRLGGGISPGLRGKRFESFVEGHARIERVDEGEKQVFFGFDNQSTTIGPILLPLHILNCLQQGDVLDVELGQRGGQWVMVDIGPVYPSCIYMEADELKIPDKLT